MTLVVFACTHDPKEVSNNLCWYCSSLRKFSTALGSITYSSKTSLFCSLFLLFWALNVFQGASNTKNEHMLTFSPIKTALCVMWCHRLSLRAPATPKKCLTTYDTIVVSLEKFSQHSELSGVTHWIPHLYPFLAVGRPKRAWNTKNRHMVVF